MAHRIWRYLIVLALLTAFGAHAAQEANLTIDTPAVAALRKGLRENFQQLRPLFESGAVGLTRDGNIALRDASAIPLAQRAQVNALIAQSNQDRAALYREIAIANGRPEWENEIRSTFAQRWIERARPGWYYQDTSGTWVKK
ncbi:MAG TPA: YdbL family protein [Burkholderiales bacterium]|nr:YdbL family protein [Burkholderiales bacterium]